jgi:SAM-dependent methyltransferase
MKCNLCNGDIIKEDFEYQGSVLSDKDKFPLYRCKTCGIVFTYPTPNNGIDIDNLNFESNVNPLINFIRYYTVYRWILHSCNKKVNILDFGCGRGEFVFYLRQKGWQVWGVDLMIKKSAGIQYLSYNNLLFPSLTCLKENNIGMFDVITLNYSLEHCDNSLSTLKELHTLLSPEGLIFIRVPNFDYILRNKKLSSFQLKIPLHRYFFTVENLAKLLKDAGFTVLSIDKRFCITSALTVPCSIFPKLDPMDWLYEKRMAIRFGKGLTLGILCLAFLPYVLLKSLIGQGAILHAVAQKSVR